MKSMDRPVLSVIIPVYNEAPTIVMLLHVVANAAYNKQIIVVDDGSTDAGVDLVERWAQNAQCHVTILRHQVNRGKGMAIRTGLEAATGQLVLIQDADLEYEPADYPRLVEPILDGGADVVFGSRYLSGEYSAARLLHRFGVCVLNLLVRLLYGQLVTDEATCYKVMPTRLLRRFDLKCERFEFCAEVTAKVCRLKLRLVEVPIRYRPRTAAEGKKIRWHDGLQAVWTLLRWRFARLEALGSDETQERAARGGGAASLQL